MSVGLEARIDGKQEMKWDMAERQLTHAKS